MSRRNTLQEQAEEEPSPVLNKHRKTILNSLKAGVIDFFMPKSKSSLKESLEEILEEQDISSDPQEAGERAIIRNALEFNELYVEDIMIPRADIFAFSINVEGKELVDLLHEKTYTRIPIYKEDLDEIKGFIHIKDIARSLLKEQKIELEPITRKCLFVPASMKISNLLIKMQQTRVHIAIVVDEYGGTEGLVTLEDILEEIVGKIEDEHDVEGLDEIHFNKVAEGEWTLSSRVKLADFEEKTGINLAVEDKEANEIETIGGLIFNRTGRIPTKGEIVEIYDGLEAQILTADARTIKKVKILDSNFES